jgi:hypothetical protein
MKINNRGSLCELHLFQGSMLAVDWLKLTVVFLRVTRLSSRK